MERQQTGQASPPAEDGRGRLKRAASSNIVGITYRQLDYWARADLIRPSISHSQGVGRSVFTPTRTCCS